MPGAAVKIQQFGGMLPAWDNTLLPDGQASLAVNCYLFSGALMGWRKPKRLRDLTNPNAKSVYRVPRITGANEGADTLITASDSIWLEFEDSETDVMRSPVVNDSFGRYYFASPSGLPRYNTYARIANGDPAFKLGVPAPGCNPGVSVDGGGETSTLGFNLQDSEEIHAPGSNFTALVKITPTGELNLSSVSFQAATDNLAAKFRPVVYSDSDGKPDALIDSGDELQGATAGEVSLPFDNPVALLANATYWVGVMFDTAIDVQLADANTTGVRFEQTFSNGPQTNVDASEVEENQPNWMIWATLEGDSVFSARAYVYTWVSAYGEEGPPSPPTLVNGWANGTWTVSLFSPPSSDRGVDRNIAKKRLYRTVSSNTGQTTYFFLAELDPDTETYIDTEGDDTVAFRDQLASTFWFPPPEDLQGMLALPNGIAVGFRANEIWFSEPYRPHAWNPSYVLTTEFPIVGIGVTGTSVVACTKGMPYIANGVNPASMALVKVQIPEPCLARSSIVGTDGGVMYVSNNGLIQVNQAGLASNITETWITRERWRELTPPKNIHAIKLASSYFAYGVQVGTDESVAQQGFTVELGAADQQSFTIWPQPGGHRLGFSKLTAPDDVNVQNVSVDPWTGIGLLIQDGEVRYYDFADQAPEIMPYLWRSKVYHQNAKKNFEAIRIFFDVPPGTPEQAETRNVAATQELAEDQYGIVRVYANETVVTTREIRTNGELMRILSGFKAERWQFELEGRVSISNMQVATTVKELAGV